MSTDRFEVFALKYAERNGRTRNDSFMFDDDHASQHDMDYFIWVARNAERTILIDTGYGATEARRRNRPILNDPIEMLARLEITPTDVTDVVITHLHYDHAGGLQNFEHAQFHMQEAELGFAVSGCMCHPTLRAPFTAEHVCTTVRQLYSGKVSFYTGSGQVAPGLRVHHVGGHSNGLQVVEIDTETGPLVLASDASHYYENYQQAKLFPIVVDPPAMLDGFARLRAFEGQGHTVVPGHDPAVLDRFPTISPGVAALRPE